MIFSLRDATVVLVLYLFGPMSVPSASLNLISIESSPPSAIDFLNQISLTDKTSTLISHKPSSSNWPLIQTIGIFHRNTEKKISNNRTTVFTAENSVNHSSNNDINEQIDLVLNQELVDLGCWWKNSDCWDSVMKLMASLYRENEEESREEGFCCLM